MPNQYPNIGRAPLPRWAAILAAAAAAALAALLGCAPVRAAEPPPGGVRVPLTLSASDTPPSVLKLSHGNSGCSATVIASESGRSLVLSCAHCFGAAPSRGYRPLARVSRIDTGAAYDAVGITGDDDADCALLLVASELPAAPVSGTLPPAGATVEHWGITSKHATGRVLPVPNYVRPLPTQLFRSTLSSIPGDSGAAVWHAGKVVAWNWGYYQERERVQAGTPVAFAVAVAVASEEVRRLFPRQCAEWGAPKEPAPPVVPPVVVPPDVPPAVPPLYCPPPVDRRGPVRRFLFPRR